VRHAAACRPGARRTVAVATLLALALLVAAPALAAAACPRTSLTDVADEVMCKTCGTPLSVANGPGPDAQRRFIQTRIDRCESKAQIKREYAANYGEDSLALPSGKGFGLAAYLVPAGALLAALAGLAVALPRWRRRRIAPIGEQPAAELAEADARRLEADLGRYE